MAKEFKDFTFMGKKLSDLSVKYLLETNHKIFHVHMMGMSLMIC